MAKDSFIVYTELLKQTAMLTNEQFGELFRAMFQYQIDGEPPAFTDPMVEFAFSFVQPGMDRNNKKWEARALKNQENGKKGGRPPKVNEREGETPETQRKKEKPKNPAGFSENPEKPEPASPQPQRKQTASRPQKVQWAEDVTMTNEEYQKLIDAYGPADTTLMIEKLNNYKLSTGKKYKSDYRALLSWGVEALEEHKRKGAQRNTRPAPRSALIPEQPMTQDEKAAQDQRLADNQAWMAEFLSSPTPRPDG